MLGKHSVEDRILRREALPDLEELSRRIDLLAGAYRIQIATFEQGLHQAMAARHRNLHLVGELRQQQRPPEAFEALEQVQRPISGSDSRHAAFPWVLILREPLDH